MKWAIVDALLERHLTESLARALVAGGDRVLETGPIWSGWREPEAADDVARIAAEVSRVIAYGADAVFVARPAALRREDVLRLQASGAVVIAWFADDPVYFGVHSRQASAWYDITLHTATPRVLERYEKDAGVFGWGFQFWADPEEFPDVYRTEAAQHDLVFLGNAHTRVKRWRYDWIASLPLDVRMYGRVVHDPAGIHGGELGNNRDVSAAIVTGRLGLNIPQRLAGYRGSEFDRSGMELSDDFVLPSRMVQYAATGTPVVSFLSSDRARGDLEPFFAPGLAVGSREELVRLSRSLDDAELASLSSRTRSHFRMYYTAERRALFLRWLLAHAPVSRRLDSETRALAFMEWEGEERRLLLGSSRLGRFVRGRPRVWYPRRK